MMKKFTKQDKGKKIAIDGGGDGCVLPDVVVEDILSRLGIKILLKLRIVCKKWRSLISDCRFRRLHYEKSLKYPNVLVLSQRRSSPGDYVLTTVSLGGDVLERWDFPLPSGCTLKMLLSDWGPNNLVCFTVNRKRFIVCNPSVRRMICLPELPDSEDINGYGFCYLPSMDNYVVICNLRRDQWQMITFSYSSNLKDLSTGGWKPFTNTTSCELERALVGLFVNGVFYWIGLVRNSYRREPTYGRFWTPCLLCFGLYEEKFFEVACPKEVDGIYSTLHNVNGCLHLFSERDYLPTTSRTLWKLGDARKWIKQYTIYPAELSITPFMAPGLHFTVGELSVTPFLAPDLYFTPLMVSEDGEMLVFRGGFLEWYRPLHEGFTERRGHKSFQHRDYIIVKMKFHNDTLLLS